MKPPHGISPSSRIQSLNKQERLKQFADRQEDEIFGDIEGIDFGISHQMENTLRVNRDNPTDLETLKLNQLSLEDSPYGNVKTHKYNKGSRSNKSVSPQSFFLTPTNREDPLPNSGSTSSGKRITREYLSEYSEENDTDVTSEFTDNDFDGWDLLTKNEEGQGDQTSIYQKMNQHLIARKVQQQKEAEIEQEELRKLWMAKKKQEQDYMDPNQTIKLQDFSAYQDNKLTNENLSLFDLLENEKTVNYEYTRDEFDQFEDGLDDNFVEELQKRHAQRVHNINRNPKSSLRNKQSMPSIARTSKPSIKRFQSTMEFAKQSGLDGIQEEPAFKYNDNLKRKLDRIPSFYNTQESEKKTQLLNKYRDNIKTNDSIHQQSHHKRKMGVVKCLNNNRVTQNPSFPTPTKNMTFNYSQNRWEGNEEELMRFENLSKPALITTREFEEPVLRLAIPTKGEGTHNMAYDKERLCWVNLDGEDDAIFHDIPDLIEAKPYKLNAPPQTVNNSAQSIMKLASQQHMNSPTIRRGASQFTQRTTSNISTGDVDGRLGQRVANDDDHNEFKLSKKLIEKFVKEDSRIERKTRHWFNNNSTRNSGFNRDYYWEIRKMVIENE
ncbi:BFA1 [[Candida] subhashii]|uniref:BFA1 n=1 Tax=[Candida] subhashii TaxID=561895 RepID=A0A8J5ULF1_9ASCO|nr:BFA1 [[Candida] subhashii]KAG7662597.1 BFA1 [[Candida] subhashii]